MTALRNPQRWRSLLSALELFADSEFLLSRSTMLSASGAMQIPAEKCFYDFCRSNKPEESSTAYSEVLRRTLTAYGVDLDSDNPQPALWRLSKTRSNPEQRHRLASAVVQLAIGLQEAGLDLRSHAPYREPLSKARHSHRDRRCLGAPPQASYVLFQQQEYALQSQASISSHSRVRGDQPADGKESSRATMQRATPGLAKRSSADRTSRIQSATECWNSPPMVQRIACEWLGIFRSTMAAQHASTRESKAPSATL